MKKDKLSGYLERGIAIRKIAKIEGVGYSTVRYWIGKHNLEIIPIADRAIYICKSCGSSTKANHYGRVKSVCKKCSNNLRAIEMRSNTDRAIAYKGGKCYICGYNKCYGSLHFHHRDPETKDQNFNSKAGWSWERLRTEIDKCDLVCANCHGEIHYKTNMPL